MTDTQCSMILEHLKKHKTISAREAVEKFNCFRLAARIADLRAAGYPIETRLVTEGKTRYAVYEMEESNERDSV